MKKMRRTGTGHSFIISSFEILTFRHCDANCQLNSKENINKQLNFRSKPYIHVFFIHQPKLTPIDRFGIDKGDKIKEDLAQFLGIKIL